MWTGARALLGTFTHASALLLTTWLQAGTIWHVGRFDDADPKLGALDNDEQFAPAERAQRRHVLDPSPWGRVNQPSFPEGASAKERRAIHQKWLADNGLQPEDEVRTDAVTAVEEGNDEWRVRWVLAEQAGAVVVRAVTVEPQGRQTPPGGVTSNLLRELRPARAAAASAPHFARSPDVYGSQDDDLIELFARQARRTIADLDMPEAEPRRTGRPPLSDEHLAAVAVAYLEELPRGRGMHRRLGERFDRRPETMRDQVRAARRAGFLSDDAKIGRRGASPGPRLIELLKQYDEPAEDGDDG